MPEVIKKGHNFYVNEPVSLKTISSLICFYGFNVAIVGGLFADLFLRLLWARMGLTSRSGTRAEPLRVALLNAVADDSGPGLLVLDAIQRYTRLRTDK